MTTKHVLVSRCECSHLRSLHEIISQDTDRRRSCEVTGCRCPRFAPAKPEPKRSTVPPREPPALYLFDWASQR